MLSLKHSGLKQPVTKLRLASLPEKNSYPPILKNVYLLAHNVFYPQKHHKLYLLKLILEKIKPK